MSLYQLYIRRQRLRPIEADYKYILHYRLVLKYDNTELICHSRCTLSNIVKERVPKRTIPELINFLRNEFQYFSRE